MMSTFFSSHQYFFDIVKYQQYNCFCWEVSCGGQRKRAAERQFCQTLPVWAMCASLRNDSKGVEDFEEVCDERGDEAEEVGGWDGSHEDAREEGDGQGERGRQAGEGEGEGTARARNTAAHRSDAGLSRSKLSDSPSSRTWTCFFRH